MSDRLNALGLDEHNALLADGNQLFGLQLVQRVPHLVAIAPEQMGQILMAVVFTTELQLETRIR